MECVYKNSKKDVFILPTLTGDNYLYYSPLRDSSFEFSQGYIDEIINYYDNNIVPFDETLKNYFLSIEAQETSEPVCSEEIDTRDRAVIILTQKCNLACSYCFAQSSRSTAVLSLEKLYAVIDHMFSTNNNKAKIFSFIGGGEPLVCWSLIKDAADYVRRKSDETGISYRFGIVTNATLLSEEKIRWIAENKILISVSFDVLPDIQNSQRPYAFKKAYSFDSVDRAIKLLSKYKVTYKLRATITRLNVHRMSEMVQFIHDNYPDVRSLHLEPVTDSAEEYDAFYSEYIENFFKSYQLGKKVGIRVNNSLSSSFFHIKRHFCQGELCVTPTGDIVSCHRHSSKDDVFYDACKYGDVKDKVEINGSLLHNVITLRQERTSECDECFAKWHCAGGCASQKMVFAQKQRSSYCNYVKTFIRNMLELQIKEQPINN